ncbi:MAG: flagellin [Anaerolineaceae bacterium]|nr:flagellin [Anaerolineaceae bacterium]
MPNYDVTRVAGNIGALNALNALNNINNKLAVHQARLATGKRITSAGDDPAGLTIATKLQARSESLKTALDNIGDAKNLLAVAESGAGRINDILVQMRNKAMQGASDTMGSSERTAIKAQLTAYAAQIDDIVAQTTWDGTTKLLDGSKTGTNALNFQTGSGTTVNDVTTLDLSHNLGGHGLGVVDYAVDTTPPETLIVGLATATDFKGYLTTLDTAIGTVSGVMSDIGSMEGRLSFKEEQVSNAQINIEGSYNRIMNANMAEEQVNASKYQILQQTATAMLAQANAAPQFLLSLFR